MNIRPPGIFRGFFLSLLFFPLFFSSPASLPALAEKKPVLSDMISYWSPQWFNNERIIYIKWIEHKRYWYGFLADISNGGTIHLGEDYQICTADLAGRDEKVIRAFSVRRDRWKLTKLDPLIKQDDGGKTEGILIPRLLSCNPTAGLIAFSGQDNGAIIVMTTDGQKVWRLDVGGYAPAISPDGKKVMYHKQLVTYLKNAQGVVQSSQSENSIWLINVDGTENKKIIDNATASLWHPDGKRIIFYRDNDVYVFNLEDSSEEILFKQMSPPSDISLDGNTIFLGRGVYDFTSGKSLKIDNIPNEAHISPDGSKVLGDPVEIDAKVGIVNIKGTDQREIFKDHAVTIK